MNFLKVKNFDTYQHYKDRERLHWIKLQIKILDDFDIDQLDDVSKGHIVFIWLLAAKLNNKIPFDADWIQKKIGSKVKPKIEMFIERGFLLLHEESEGDLSNFVPNGTESHEVMLLRRRKEEEEETNRTDTCHL